MSRYEKLKTLSLTQLAFVIWVLLLCKNTPLKGWRAISDVTKWLSEEWVEDEYTLYN